jgi:hypothetical protein
MADLDVFDSSIRIEIRDMKVFQSEADPNLYLQILELKLDSIEVFGLSIDDKIRQTCEYISTVAVTIMAGCLIVSPKHGIAIIKVFQMVDYFLYFNADTPANLAGFLQIFSETPLGWLPNPFDLRNNENSACSPAKKFEENGMKCYILENVGNFVLQISVM